MTMIAMPTKWRSKGWMWLAPPILLALLLGPVRQVERSSNPQSPIPYSAAKAGSQILTQDVAAQAGPYGIRANCIAPETILTERNRERIPDAQQNSLKELHPLKRLGTPEDVARAALFLASDEASWVTGVVLDVAGGAVMV